MNVSTQPVAAKVSTSGAALEVPATALPSAPAKEARALAPIDGVEARPVPVTQAPAADVTGMQVALAGRRPVRPGARTTNDYTQFKSHTRRVQQSLQAADRWIFMSPFQAQWELRDAIREVRWARTARAPAQARFAIMDAERRINAAWIYTSRVVRNPSDTFSRMQAQSEIWFALRDIERALREVERAEQKERPSVRRS